jgi:hypothetical protein
VLSVQLRSDNQLFNTPQTLAISGATVARTLKFAPGGDRSLHLPLVPRRGVCQVEFLISPTRRPVDFPKLKNDDTRSLGLHFDSIHYVPPTK